MKKNLRNRNFTNVKNHVLPADCIELTEAELFLVNGGREVENSNAGVANAQVGDTVTRNDNTTVTITQGDIDWAQAHCEGGDNSNNGDTGAGDMEAAPNSPSPSAPSSNPSAYGAQSQPGNGSGAPTGMPSNGGYNEMPVPEATQYITVDEHGNTFGEKQYGDKYVLAVPAGYAQNYLDACNAYFVGRNDGSVPGRKVDGIALTNTEGEVVHLFSTPESIEGYRKNIDMKKCEATFPKREIFETANSIVSDYSSIYETTTKSSALKKINLITGVAATADDTLKFVDEPSFRNGYNICSDLASFISTYGIFINLGMRAFSSYADYKIESLYGKPENEDSNPYIYNGTF